MDVLNKLAFWFWQFLYNFALAMSGFVSSMRASLSTMRAKDIAIRGFVSSMSGSLSSMSDSKKMGPSSFSGCPNNSGFWF